jgi:hypothetical protein
MQIAVGQKWKTRSGEIVTVVQNDRHEDYPWDLSNGECVTFEGRVIGSGIESSSDLIELIESPLAVQVGGSHYKDLAIQPVVYCHKNGLGTCESNVIKYVTRWRAKNGIADLQKARHYIDLLIEMEGGAV